MATHNGSRHIKAQLESLAAQEYLPSELVVTDDMSTDRTIEMIEEFALTAPFPVRIHQNKLRLGFKANFMLAASLCRSELIAFSDQDDVWYPQKIAATVEPFTDSEVLLVHHNADVLSEHNSYIDTLSRRTTGLSIYLPLSFPWAQARGFTQVQRRSLLRFSDLWSLSFDEEGRERERLSHDIWFFFLASVFGRVGYVHSPLAAYRRHDRNLSGWRRERLLPGAANSMFTNYAERYARYAEGAEARGKVLEAAKARLEGAWQCRAAAAEQRYKRLSRLLQSRRALYTAQSAPNRLRIFYALYRSGGYQDQWGLGRKSLIKDFCLGVVLAPSLRKGKHNST
jgi:glycosyltransferase involved in cell wall biosynthesis